MDDFEWFAPLVNFPDESSAWACKLCGMNGTCVPGDEEMILRIHHALMGGKCGEVAPWDPPNPVATLPRQSRLRRLISWVRIQMR